MAEDSERRKAWTLAAPEPQSAATIWLAAPSEDQRPERQEAYLHDQAEAHEDADAPREATWARSQLRPDYMNSITTPRSCTHPARRPTSTKMGSLTVGITDRSTVDTTSTAPAI